MARIGVFVASFVLYLLFVDCHAAETDVKKADPNSVLDPKDGSRSVEKLKTGSDSESAKVDEGKKGGVLGGGLEGEVKKDSGVNDSHGNSKVEKDKSGMSKDLGVDGGQEKKGSTNEGSDSKVAEEGAIQGGDSALQKASRKENSRAEECDASNMCTDDKNKLVACFKVPGNESPDLLLLIQNKGTESLTVKITAPNSVDLEQTTVQLPGKEDKKVKASIGSSIGSSVSDRMIVLKTGTGVCKLDLPDIPNSGKGTEHAPQSRYSIIFTHAFAICVFVAAVLLIGAAWACVKFRKGQGFRYRKVEMELPVSNGGKMESDTSDGWDNSWGDNWDDEEAPKTPSQPVSNLSSKGLASRRSNNKDGWQNSWKD
ncbi:uncharacterized protein LOC131241242 [Magnolia sinica]|uniref:uncharacterized protein LOC131241242 n=1 Tax=Magnolia sinica TaxID=86752 RepID=UPI00265A5DAF|nr:uncharacterized protein LOC131241242 [Magnolia sinica]